MFRAYAHPIASVLVAFIFSTPSSFAFDTPLSDQAVREAYFLGQRHDETMSTLLNKYTKLLPPPKTGPDISSVTFLTPFALLVQQSSEHTSGYSAQQAALDHRGLPILMDHLSFAPPVPAPVRPQASSPVPMISGQISTSGSPAKSKSCGPSPLWASPISSAPKTAAARSQAPRSNLISPSKTLPPAPPPSTSLPRRAIPSLSTSISITSADVSAPLLLSRWSRQCHHSAVTGPQIRAILFLGKP